MSLKIKILIGFIALIALAGGVYFNLQHTTKQDNTTTTMNLDAANIIGTKRIDFTLKDTDNKVRKLSDWDGKVVMINFWATWCPPCRREIPAFIELYDQYRDQGFIILGVALDTPQAATDFVDPMGINYPILVAEEEGIDLTHRYGNELGVLPYSVIVDRDGIIRHTIRHELTRETVIKMITPLL